MNPLFRLGNAELLMVTQYIAAVPEAALGRPKGFLRDEADRITGALDMLFHGF